MKRKLRRFVLIYGLAAFFAILLLGSSGAGSGSCYACSCAQRSFDSELAASRGVFAGNVVSVEEIRTRDGLRFGVIPTYRLEMVALIEVTDVWKGDVPARVTVHTGIGGGDCGYAFQQSDRYLIFAGGEDEWRTSICSRTKPLSAAGTELALLGKGKQPSPAATLTEAKPGPAAWGTYGVAILFLMLVAAGWKYFRMKR